MIRLCGPLFQFGLGEKYPVKQGLKKVRYYEESYAIRVDAAHFVPIRPHEARVLQLMTGSVFDELVEYFRGQQ
jgi:hypothetical protein